MILFVDVLVHDWLCEHWIVTFIVAVATVANLKLFVRGQKRKWAFMINILRLLALSPELFKFS